MRSCLWRTNYAKFAKGFLGGPKIASGLTALTFTGGCLAVVIFPVSWLWRMRVLAPCSPAGSVLLAAANYFGRITVEKKRLRFRISRLISVEFQIIFWAVVGLGVLAMAVADVLGRRDARSWLLAFAGVGELFCSRRFSTGPSQTGGPCCPWCRR